MGIANFPTQLQPMIQQGFLERAFDDALKSKLVYRSIARRELFPNRIGETVTKTRTGWLAPATTPKVASANTGLDNGLSATNWSIEQFTLSINMYANSMDLNTVQQKVGIKDQFLKNSAALGYNAAQTLDDLARNVLFSAYLGGNSRVTTTLGANGATITVDDVTGFQQVYVPTSGAFVAVSTSNKLPVTVNGVVHNLQAFTVDGSNTSTTPLGVSGTLTMDANVLIANGTAGNPVIAASGSFIVRPSGRATTAALSAGDVLGTDQILDAVAYLRANQVPEADGYYHCFLDPVSERQLFSDANFRQLFQGRGTEGPMGPAYLGQAYGVRFFRTTEVSLQNHPTLTGVKVRRPIICGYGALVEGDFEGMASMETAPEDSEVFMIDDIVHVIREPLDRLQQQIAMSWYWIGGFVAPSDITTDTVAVPTASAARFKRAVVIEHVG